MVGVTCSNIELKDAGWNTFLRNNECNLLKYNSNYRRFESSSRYQSGQFERVVRFFFCCCCRKGNFPFSFLPCVVRDRLSPAFLRRPLASRATSSCSDGSPATGVLRAEDAAGLFRRLRALVFPFGAPLSGRCWIFSCSLFVIC